MPKQPVSNTGKEQHFSASQILLSTTDLKGQVTYANNDFCQIAGYSINELVGHGHNIVRHSDMPKAAFADLWSTIRSGDSWMGPVKNSCKNGDHYWVNAYVTPIKDQQGNVFEYQSVRTKLDEDVKARATETYHNINNNKVPLKQKLSKLDTTLYVQHLFLFTALFIAICAFTTTTPIFVSIPLLVISLVGWSIFLSWRVRYKKVLAGARKVFNNPLMGYIYSGTTDSIGQVDLALSMRKAELNAIIGRVTDLSQNVTSIAQETANNGNNISQMLNEQDVEVEQVATAMGQMSFAINEVSGSVTGAAEASQQGKDLSGEGVVAVNETVEAVQSLSTQLASVEAVIGKLADGRHDIAAISDEISSIADQTNLLALNAAIEAARAGEQGRGFAVVAEEVRALAQRTQQSTEEISKTLASLNQESLQAIESINDGVTLVEQCVAFAKNTGDSLKNIDTEVDKIAAINYQVATSIEEQSVVSEQVTGNAESIKAIAKLGVEQGIETKQLSKNLLEELITLHNLIRQFDAQ